MPPAAAKSAKRPRKQSGIVNAETMAKGQREISVSEFFAKNRHLLGFDNPRKALLTTVKEAVDNALDACEEAGMLPDLFIGIEQLSEARFRITIRDNGPGIVKSQVANIFGKLLYGSKFHRLKMSRGQQGIGIAAAGMYGLMTTGKPMVIHTKPHKSKPSHCITLAIDTQKNKADITDEVERHDFPSDTGTEVVIELEGKYNKGKQSVDEYLEQTAIANPHSQIIYQPPTACRSKDEDNGKDLPTLIDDYEHAAKLAPTADGTTTTPGGTVIFPRTVKELPEEPKEIKPHPKGIELGTLLKMLRTSDSTQLGGFLQKEFCRVSLTKANEICDAAQKIAGGDSTITNRTWLKNINHAEAEAIYKAIQQTKLMSPPTDCLSPIGVKQILAGLLKGVKAEFFTATTRPPSVYRGNPFQIEVGMAFGGELPKDELGRVIRFANRVPLLYQQSSCCAYKGVLETSWRNYGMSQSRGALPQGPLIVFVHMASVWVPFTSESKEAIADYDEIRKEIKLAISECGRKLNTYVRRRQRMRREGERRSVFERYIGEVAQAIEKINPKHDAEKLVKQFESVATRITEMADMEFDEDGKPIPKSRKKKKEGLSALDNDEGTVILAEAAPEDVRNELDGKATGRGETFEDETDDEESLF
jgi:DNA topoisomerase-6 subunit B